MPAPRLPDPPLPPPPPPPAPGDEPEPPDDLGALGRPPPDRGIRLPEWADDLRLRVGLDHRAVVWVLLAVVAAGGAAWLLRPAPAPVEEALPMAASSADDGAGDGAEGAAGTTSASSTSEPTASREPEEVVVHAAGAVRSPGVYPLAGDARVDDLVRAAGGLAPDADAGRLNLAAPLSDGARVYVPHVGEAEPPAVVGADGATPGPAAGADGGPGPAGDDPAGEAGAPIDLNSATEEELDSLPGVGPAIAGAIISFREDNGGFASVDDLLDVRGIGEARLAEIRPLVTV